MTTYGERRGRPLWVWAAARVAAALLSAVRAARRPPVTVSPPAAIPAVRPLLPFPVVEYRSWPTMTHDELSLRKAERELDHALVQRYLAFHRYVSRGSNGDV